MEIIPSENPIAASPAPLPTILELNPGAPKIVRKAKHWSIRLGILGLLTMIGSTAWFGFRHVLAVVHLDSSDMTVRWREDDSAIRGSLTISRAQSYGRNRLIDSDLTYLHDLFWVRSLDLSHCPGITDDATIPIASMKPLRELFFSRTKQPWNSNDNELYGPKITDIGISRLKDLKELQVLSLDGSLITDASLALIGKMTKLDTLDISNTAITDVGLAHLKGLKALRFLRVEGTQVTCQGRLDFLASLPDVDVLLPKCNYEQPSSANTP